jgi:hypothetical protein
MVSALPAPARVVAAPRSAVLAGVLEWLMPGVGLIYGGSGCAGAFVLVLTLGATLLLLLYGLALAGAHVRPLLVGRYFFFTALVLLIWLLLRTLWAVLAAQRHNETLQAPPLAPSPTSGLPTGGAYPRPPQMR